MGDARLSVDLERGSVAFEMSRDVALGAKAHLPELKGGGLKLTPTASLAQAQLAQQDTVRLEARLRHGELEQLKRGQLDPGSLLQAERLQVTLVQSRELDVAGARVRAQREFLLTGLLPPGAQDPEQGLWEVSGGVDAGGGAELGFKTGALDLKAALKLEAPLFEGGTVLLPLRDVENAVLSRVQEQQREDALVRTQLAVSRSR
jgi:hypothetical protein